MAAANPIIIETLRKTVKNLYASSDYQWGHMGSCNCGFLAQTVTRFNKEEIHSRAMQRYGDWSEQLNDYCTTSGFPIDDIISEMVAIGFDVDDLRHLEKLSDPKILNVMPFEERNLKHNVKSDVIRYLETWIALLENELLEKIEIPAASLIREEV
jgi:hypothetical protein